MKPRTNRTLPTLFMMSAVASCGGSELTSRTQPACWTRFTGYESASLCVRVANEYGCEAQRIQMTPLGAGAFRVDACGATDTFVCLFAGGNVACSREPVRSSPVPVP